MFILKKVANLLFGYIEVYMDGVLVLRKPVVNDPYNYFTVDSLDGVLVKLDRKALKKLRGKQLIILCGGEEYRYVITGKEKAPLVLSDFGKLKQKPLDIGV